MVFKLTQNPYSQGSAIVLSCGQYMILDWWSQGAMTYHLSLGWIGKFIISQLKTDAGHLFLDA